MLFRQFFTVQYHIFFWRQYALNQTIFKYFNFLCRISYCSADATFTHVFAFIAVNRAECLQCHAFLARKQKIVSFTKYFLDHKVEIILCLLWKNCVCLMGVSFRNSFIKWIFLFETMPREFLYKIWFWEKNKQNCFKFIHQQLNFTWNELYFSGLQLDNNFVKNRSLEKRTFHFVSHAVAKSNSLVSFTICNFSEIRENTYKDTKCSILCKCRNAIDTQLTKYTLFYNRDLRKYHHLTGKCYRDLSTVKSFKIVCFLRKCIFW